MTDINRLEGGFGPLQLPAMLAIVRCVATAFPLITKSRIRRSLRMRDAAFDYATKPFSAGFCSSLLAGWLMAVRPLANPI
jgi:hypothetical protein